MAKICVIGAGASGLTTIKQLLDEGHKSFCFEKAEDIGGLFNIKTAERGKGRVYKNTVLTISNYFMAYSDLSPKESERIHWNHEQYLQYLQDYSSVFGLQRFINYGQEITLVEKVENKWKVTSKCLKSGNEEITIFDGVAICSGTHQEPNIPNFKREDSFIGEILHSSNYDDNNHFKGKKVVVIGIGESSADIVREISDVAEQCHLLIRSYPFIIPRNQKGEAADANTSRAISEYSYPKSKILQLYLLISVIIERILNFSKNLFCLKRKLERDSFSQSTDLNFIDHSTPYSEASIKLIKSWNILAGITPERKFATKNATFVENIVSKKIKVTMEEVDYLTPNGLKTKGGKSINCDTIMLCTGYKESFSFLKGYEVKDNNVRNLYLNAFHPEMENVAFIGWNRPSLGAIPTCSEMIARYYALILSKKKSLPKNIDSMIVENKKEADNRFKFSPSIITVIDYHEFMNKLSKLIGCNIKWYRFLFKPLMLYKLVFGSHLSAQYRLFGPHSMQKSSENTIKKLRVSPTIKNISLKASFAYLLGIKVQNKKSHKDLINDFLFPEIRVDDEDIKKYSVKK